jgi:hypothetical protein
MKNTTLYLIAIIVFIISCSKENKEPDPLDKTDDKKPHYQIKFRS